MSRLCGKREKGNRPVHQQSRGPESRVFSPLLMNRPVGDQEDGGLWGEHPLLDQDLTEFDEVLLSLSEFVHLCGG